jgi:polysaccharide export outer membrane protein
MQITYSQVVIGLSLLWASCASPKKTVYFYTNVPNDTLITSVPSLPRPEVLIGSDDILAINVSSVDAFTQKDPVSIFNDGGVPYNIAAQGSGVGTGTSAKGFLVNPDGCIDFPVLGRVKLAGLTPTQAKELLSQKLASSLKSPVVEVRILNYKVNVCGEVGRVGPVVAPNHKINIIEALAAAGDIPATGRKDNVMIIREHNGRQEFGHIDLNSRALFTSPYFYLQKNDIVYVEPNRLKKQQNNEFLHFYLPTIMGFVSSVLSVYGIVQLVKQK